MTNSRNSAWKRLLAVMLSVAVVISMGAWSTVAVNAEAAPVVSIFLVGKDGQDKTLAQWNYDSQNKTYTENGAEVGLVKDFTNEENLAGEVNGNSYDFTDIGALPYTGINKKPDPRCLSVTTKGILLEDLYDYAEGKAGMDLRGNTMMYLSDSNNFNDTFTYDQYWGLDRYYYPDWYSADPYSENDMGDTERYVPTTLAVLGYHGTTGANLENLISSADDLYSLRISSGMQKDGNKTIEAIDGTTYGQGDINEGKLSVKNISIFRFTPVYNEIGFEDAVIEGTEGKDLHANVEHAVISTGDNYFKAAKGEKVKLNIRTDSGYAVENVVVKDENDNEIDVTKENGNWIFQMPSGKVTVSAVLFDVADKLDEQAKQIEDLKAETEKAAAAASAANEAAKIAAEKAIDALKVAKEAAEKAAQYAEAKGDNDQAKADDRKAVKKAQPMKVTVKEKTFKAKKLKKKAKTFKLITVKKAKGKVTYAKVSGSKKLKINKKTGKLTLKKKTGKGVYKIKVKVKAAGNNAYKAGSKKVIVIVKVD